MNLWLPNPRQQFVETVDRMSVDHAREHVGEVSVGFDAVEFSIVEISDVDHALKVIGARELRNDFVDFIADFLVAFEGHHVGETAALWHLDKRVLLSRVLIRHVLHEKENEDVILVLGGVHTASQSIAALPKRAINFRFLDRQRRPHTMLYRLLLRPFSSSPSTLWEKTPLSRRGCYTAFVNDSAIRRHICSCRIRISASFRRLLPLIRNKIFKHFQENCRA